MQLRSLAAGVVLAFSAVSAAHAQQANSFDLGVGSYVYVMSNDIKANTVAVLRRSFFGGLDKIQVAATGGVGVGVGTTAPPPDPLGSQNELLASQDGKWLFAVNAGSNQVSVFSIRRGSLALQDVVSSGGDYPVSLAQRGDQLYVLNSANEANIATFQIGRDGHLRELPGSSRFIGTDVPLAGNQPNVGNTAAQLQFSPDGKWLAVTVKNSAGKGSIELFATARDGSLAQDPVTTPSPDASPFGFAFDENGHLLVSEAAASAASSYAVQRNGQLSPISASVANGQAAACWLATSGHFAYTANAGASTLSGYRVDGSGHLQLLSKDGVSGRLPTGSAPTDTKISRDGRFLEVLTPGTGNINTFFVLGDGHLVFLGDTPVFPALSGMQGLAVTN
ncbi:lactonase family protein [Pinirhizobacter sp.]|jgi:6-phosphogluconolactonase (cycloisomerase 2 family)|uniref:lactonase family protein n=1 Tax=Pinirhizobacter sp. TaxID=2950432 RepID=UPI002F42C1E4